MRGRATGFTLMELLIAIAIIVILAGILLPVARGARVRADAATCVNNIRQIGVALQMYAHDWDGCAPPYTTQDLPERIIIGSGETPEVWELPPLDDAAALKRCFAPYGAGNDELWFCPLDQDVGRPKSERITAVFDHTETSYWVDPILATRCPVRLDRPPVLSLEAYDRARAGPDPQVPYLHYKYWVDTEDVDYPVPRYLMCVSLAFPHGKKYPMLRLDGSVVYRTSNRSVQFPSGWTLIEFGHN